MKSDEIKKIDQLVNLRTRLGSVTGDVNRAKSSQIQNQKKSDPNQSGSSTGIGTIIEKLPLPETIKAIDLVVELHESATKRIKSEIDDFQTTADCDPKSDLIRLGISDLTVVFSICLEIQINEDLSSCASFPELHDHCDANLLGKTAEHYNNLVKRNGNERATAVIDKIQNEVNGWLQRTIPAHRSLSDCPAVIFGEVELNETRIFQKTNPDSEHA